MRRIILLLLFLYPAILFAQTNPIQIKFANGQIKAGFNTKTGKRYFVLRTIMPVTSGVLDATLISSTDNSIVTRQRGQYFNNAYVVTTTVQRTLYGLQWDIEIDGNGSDFTVPIETQLKWDDPRALKFWTTWSDNHLNPKSDQWQDPFIPAPFQDLKLTYGGESHVSKNAFVIPLASSFFNDDNVGLSFIQSLNDTILDLQMRTSADGEITYSHLNYRIGKGHVIHIRHQIVLHDADWRAGVAWMMQHYKNYFFPEEPLVNKIAGCGAYSSYEGDIDTAKYHQMGMSLNWKASLDFPYMGMFIPPVKNDDEKWLKYKQGGVQVGDGYASIKRLNDYSVQSAKMGISTLSYFNVNEFGNKMIYPYQVSAMPDSVLWHNPNDFVYTQLQQAFLKPAGQLPDWDDRPLFSNWEGCIVLDPADSTYKRHLIDQAKLHIQKLPASAGICIDRLDWMRYYNANADDGVSMVGEQKTRSLLVSWRGIMDSIGPIMHNAHKVIFCNPLDRRIDLMAHIDGIYDEFGYVPSSINLCAQMAFTKPMIAWTASKESLMPDPDAYFQHHLYLGVFLTAPFPGNDHCIGPDAWAEKYYLDYGPMLNAIKGREWLMYPHIVTVDDNIAKVNAFKANGKVIIPVVLGGKQSKATVTVKLPYEVLKKDKLEIKVLYPGEKQWKRLSLQQYAQTIKIPVALKRGCALISIG